MCARNRVKERSILGAASTAILTREEGALQVAVVLYRRRPYLDEVPDLLKYQVLLEQCVKVHLLRGGASMAARCSVDLEGDLLDPLLDRLLLLQTIRALACATVWITGGVLGDWWRARVLQRPIVFDDSSAVQA